MKRSLGVSFNEGALFLLKKIVDISVYIVYIVYIQKVGEMMRLVIHNQLDAPIFKQIYDQIKSQIIAGELKQDDALPSIRQLAKDLKVSVITTKRAYEELERDGFIYTMAKRGSYVKGMNPSLIKEEYLKQIETHLQDALDLADTVGISTAELKALLDVLKSEIEGGRK